MRRDLKRLMMNLEDYELLACQLTRISYSNGLLENLLDQVLITILDMPFRYKRKRCVQRKIISLTSVILDRVRAIQQNGPEIIDYTWAIRVKVRMLCVLSTLCHDHGKSWNKIVPHLRYILIGAESSESDARKSGIDTEKN